MIYLDNASTTRVDDRVLNEMLPYLKDDYGNAGTIYSFGIESANAIARARKKVADLIGANPEQIVFTSGGSEANNLALLGVVEHLLEIKKNRVIISAIEHDSVINAGKMLMKLGFHVSYVFPNEYGEITAGAVEKLLYDDEVGLVSVMAVNNETGIPNQVSEIGALCNERGILFHTDCVQAAGCYEIDVDELKCDMLSISSHKMHGPKGVGALYVRDKSCLKSIIHGGASQEFGLRAGTENTPGIVGFGKACEILGVELYEDIGKMEDLLIEFVDELHKNLSKEMLNNIFRLNGRGHRVKTISVRFTDIDAETLMLMLDACGLCVSAGSACRSRESEPSRVLIAMGLQPSEARNSIRVSVSKYTSFDEVRNAAKIISDCVALLSNGA